jgi:hypothetical protein
MRYHIHSVQYVRKKYKTYQFISVVFAGITIVATLSAAITGLRITQLHNRQNDTLSHQGTDTANTEKLKAEIKALKKESIANQKQLTTEKSRVKTLSAKIEALENQLHKSSRTKEMESAPAIDSPATGAKTKAGAHAAGADASEPTVVEDTKPNSPEIPLAAEPRAPQSKEADQPPSILDPQSLSKDTAPETGSVPPTSPMTTVETNPVTASEPGAEEKKPPAASATQPPVVPETDQ